MQASNFPCGGDCVIGTSSLSLNAPKGFSILETTMSSGCRIVIRVLSRKSMRCVHDKFLCEANDTEFNSASAGGSISK